MTIKYISPWKIILYAVLAILKSFQIVFIAYVFKQFINFAQNPEGSIVKLTIMTIIGLILLGIVGSLFQVYYASLVAEINLKIKKACINHLVNEKEKGRKIDNSFMTNDLKQIETNKVEAELQIIYNGIQFLSAVIVAFINSWVLSLIFLVASFMPALFQNIFGHSIEKKSEIWEKENSKYTESVNNTIKGSIIVNLYNAQKYFISRLMSAAKNMEYALKHMNQIKEVATELTTTFAYICGMILPFSFGIFFVTQGRITLGTFMMISQLANNFINPIVIIFGYINDIKTTTPIWKKIKEINYLQEQCDESVSAISQFDQLELNEACVQINGKTIFNNVSLKVTKGEKVLLEAPSGWGKSTLLNVLTGNQRLNKGNYLFNGKNVNNDWKDLHNYFSFIQQKPYIVHDTLKNNITLGKRIDPQLLDKVIIKAGLSDVVKEKGLDYQLDGQNLSGGQNQRIEIARALLSGRPVLLADEATSALDKDMSEKVHNVILKGFDGTVIEVAHKISKHEQEGFDKIIKLN